MCRCFIRVPLSSTISIRPIATLQVHFFKLAYRICIPSSYDVFSLFNPNLPLGFPPPFYLPTHLPAEPYDLPLECPKPYGVGRDGAYRAVGPPPYIQQHLLAWNRTCLQIGMGVPLWMLFWGVLPGRIRFSNSKPLQGRNRPNSLSFRTYTLRTYPPYYLLPRLASTSSWINSLGRTIPSLLRTR